MTKSIKSFVLKERLKHLIPVIFIGVFAIAGSAYLVASHAATTQTNSTQSGSSTFKLFSPGWRALGPASETLCDAAANFVLIIGNQDPAQVHGCTAGDLSLKYTLGPYLTPPYVPCSIMPSSNPDAGKCGGTNVLPASDFALGSDGKAIFANGFKDNFLVNPSNAALDTYMKQNAESAVLFSSGDYYDGILSDSMGTAPIGSNYLNEQPINPSTNQPYTDAQWLTAESSMLAAKESGLPSGKLLIMNGLQDGATYWKTPVSNSPRALLGSVNGAMAEEIFRTPTSSINAWPLPPAWLQDVNMISDVQNTYHIDGFFWTKCWSNGTTCNGTTCTDDTTSTACVDQWLRFSMASFLLGAGPNSYFNFDPDESAGAAIYYTEYNDAYKLGTASANMVEVGSTGVYKRSFSNGWDYVNPNSSAVNVSLGGTYTDLDGNNVSSYTLPADTGQIFLGSVSPSPSISSLTPNTGTTSGGTSLSIGLANFPSGTPSSVTFGGSSGTGISRSGNTVTVSTPAHSAGAVNVVVTIGSSSATDASGYTYTTPPPQYPDLIVQSLSVSPPSPSVGDQVTFSMVVKNQGTLAVPSGTAIGGAFLIDGSDVTLERGFSSGLAVGSTTTLTANEGSGSNSHSYWSATSGNHTLEGFVNDLGTIQESNSSNNTLSQALNVPVPPPPQAPHAPTNVTSPSQTSTSINLSWTASVPGTNGDPDSLLTYHINRNGVLVGSTSEGINPPTYTDTGLSPATTYSYTIYATDSANRSSADSNAFTQATQGLNCAVPPAPGNLKPTPASNGTSVALAWSAVSAKAPCAIAHYEIEQNSIVVGQVTTTSYNAVNLTPDTSYSFSVLAVTNDNKTGAASTVNVTTASVADTTPPSAPSNLVGAAVSDSQINLTWDASTDSQSGIKDYQIERDGSVISTTTSTTLSYGDSNLSPNTSYTYIVIAVNGVNLTTASAPVTVTTQAAPSTGNGGGSGGGTGSGGGSGTGSGIGTTPLIPLLQNTTSVGSGTDSSSNSTNGSDLTFNPTSSNPVSDNPSASNTSPDSKAKLKSSSSLTARLTDALAGGGLIILAVLGFLFYIKRRARLQFARVAKLGMTPPDITTLSEDVGNSRLTAGTIINPDRHPGDEEKRR